MDNAVNDKLNALAPHFDSIFVMMSTTGWSATAEKKVEIGVEIKVRASGHSSAAAAVDDLYAKVLMIHNQTPKLPAL